MRRAGGWFSRLRRRWFGTFTIDDPRPIAEGAPYTFFLPSENELLALGAGDLVKLIFRADPPSSEWDTERMWVEIERTAGNALEGRLDNQPADMPQVRPGTHIHFDRSDVIDILWSDVRSTSPPSAPERRSYWERCIVDSCVLDGSNAIELLYREAPDMTKENDRYPDSGWRIRGDFRGLSDVEIEARDAQYIALGAVLNRNDSWLHLIDAPIGSYYWRNWETGEFELADDDD